MLKKLLIALGIIKDKVIEEVQEAVEDIVEDIVEEVQEAKEEIVASVKKELSKMTKAELKQEADELGVEVDMKQKKSEIVKILEGSK